MNSVRYTTDDRDYPIEDQRDLVISYGGNGDLYVQITTVNGRSTDGVRLCTSGGASYKVPGLTNAIAEAYRCIKAVENGEIRESKMSESYISLREEVAAWRAAYPDKEYNPVWGVVDKD